MEAIRYTPDDYETLCEWWVGHGWKHSPEERTLPPVGFMVNGVAACFMNFADSDVTHICWPVSNPEAKQHDVVKAFKLIIKKLTDMVAPGNLCFFFSPTKGLKNIMIDLGFKIDCEYNSGMFYVGGS